MLAGLLRRPANILIHGRSGKPSKRKQRNTYIFIFFVLLENLIVSGAWRTTRIRKPPRIAKLSPERNKSQHEGSKKDASNKIWQASTCKEKTAKKITNDIEIVTKPFQIAICFSTNEIAMWWPTTLSHNYKLFLECNDYDRMRRDLCDATRPWHATLTMICDCSNLFSLRCSVMNYCLRLRIVGRASIECVFSVQNAAATLHKYDMSSKFLALLFAHFPWTTLQSRASTAYVFLFTLRNERHHGCRWISSLA